MSQHTGIVLAEVGFLLIFIAGIWMVAAELQLIRWHRFRIVVAGLALAVAGLLLIVATHWGHFG